MKSIEVAEIFEVRYGVNLELNRLSLDPNGINFVSRTSKNNGVSAKVRQLVGIEPIPARTISVAGGGSVMESFLQYKPYYSGRDLYYLTPKLELSDEQLLYYCACLRANKYRFNYGRQANRTLKVLKIPHPDSIPGWVQSVDSHAFDTAHLAYSNGMNLGLDTSKWSSFYMEELFEIKKGKRLTKANMVSGHTRFIGAIDSNNGLREHIGQEAIHAANTITVNYNGNGVAEAFYQEKPYWCSDDVNVLYPKFTLNKYVAMFICTVIRMEKYRFSYGRKWHVERMNRTEIKLPAINERELDLEFMENYIKTLNFSKGI